MNTLKTFHDSLSRGWRKQEQCTAPEATPSEAAFTIVELMVVLAVVVFGMLMLLPAFAHTQPQVRSIVCLDNLRQMQVGWRAYASDSADVMLPNAPAGLPSNQTWCGSGVENWGSSRANTDPASYLSGLLASYIGNRIGLYKCPADTIPSDNGQRIRTYSMNGQMGAYYIKSMVGSYNPGYAAYVKVSDLVGSVPPSMGMVFLEESMWTLEDGYFQMKLASPAWPNLPGSYHNGAMGVSFADGHVELHQWLMPETMLPVTAHTSNFGGFLPASGLSADWRWCRAHAAAPQ